MKASCEKSIPLRNGNDGNFFAKSAAAEIRSLLLKSQQTTSVAQLCDRVRRGDSVGLRQILALLSAVGSRPVGSGSVLY